MDYEQISTKRFMSIILLLNVRIETNIILEDSRYKINIQDIGSILFRYSSHDFISL